MQKYSFKNRAMTQTQTAEALEDRYLAENGGFLNLENVRAISKLRYLGRECLKATREREKAVETKIIIEDSSLLRSHGYSNSFFKLANSLALHSYTEPIEIERDIYQAPSGMNGETLKEEIIIYKLKNMSKMEYFEAKNLAKQLNIAGYARMKKEELFAALEEKRLEHEALATKKNSASSKPVIDNGYKVGQAVIFTDKKGTQKNGKLTKVCLKMVELTDSETGKLRWFNYPDIKELAVE